MAHTGSLAGSTEAFDAVCGELGVIRGDTLDDALEITELLVHTGAPAGRRLGAMTLSGAFRGLLLDAAERKRLSFPPLARRPSRNLKPCWSWLLIGNPDDGGFAAGSADTFMACLEASMTIRTLTSVTGKTRCASLARRAREIHPAHRRLRHHPCHRKCS
jgi:hypothetical protein